MSQISNHTFAVLAYKESPYLEECLASLKKQTIKSDIIIFSSTPSEFLKEKSEKFVLPLVINVKSDSIASDWSFAYNQCKTKYLTLAHQDDVYSPHYTESCLNAVSSIQNSLIVFTDYSELSGSEIRNFNPNLLIKKILLTPFLLKKSIKSPWVRKIGLSFGSYISCPTVMFHKEHVGKFEFSREFSCNMDWDAWLRLAKAKGSFIYVDKKLMLHRIHPFSQTAVNINNKTRLREEELIFERIWPKFIAKYLSKLYSIATRGYK